MDEFFDFAQLEHDSGIHSVVDRDASLMQTEHWQQLDDIMDWQPATSELAVLAASLPEASYHLPEALPSPDVLIKSGSTSSVTEPSEPHLEVPLHALPSSPREGDVIALQQGMQPVSRPQRNSNITRKPASAKRKGPSTRIPVEARQMLEEEFTANPYPCSWEIDIIAHQANLDVKRVRNWFNNTRARKKPESLGTPALAPTSGW